MATAEMVGVKDHPILITLQDIISGNGFLARITLAGRTLVRQEADGLWWMYGVRPAAIAESGSTVAEAFLRFKQAHREVLIDFAKDGGSFDVFRIAVESFFNQTDDDQRAWDEALKTVRDGSASPPEPFAKLPRQSPEVRPARIEVERLDEKITPHVASDNMADSIYLADKAA